MCANCKHTGCWIFLSLLIMMAVERIKGHDICSTTGTTQFDLKSMSLETPVVAELIEHLKVEITEEEMETFLKNKRMESSTIDCPSLMSYFSSLSKLPKDVNTTSKKAFDVKPEVWIASIVAVLVISAAGLLGVAIVPLFKKRWYDDVIQFLVALAVGCLTGDAFLHLLPHALAGEHAHDAADSPAEENGEREAALKGLVALSGIYFFYIAEKIVTTISEHRVEKEVEEQDNQSASSENKSDHGQLSILQESITSHNRAGLRRSLRRPKADLMRPGSPSTSINSNDALFTGIAARAMRTAEFLSELPEESEENQRKDILQSTVKGLKRPSQQSMKIDYQSKPVKQQNISLHGNVCVDCARDDESAKDDVIMVATNAKHGHSHKNCLMDWKNLPSSMASVAWMVIMGDGLHNFTDGMAIGVAFTSSIAGGISTSVAVFCHELPHELGDFAVLLKTGMGIKEAMFFNVFSSILCLLGMIVGIGVGNVDSASSWIFALTAGTFVYIALVDMLPELSSFRVREGQSRIVQVVIQNIGLYFGAGIMLLIALFEKEMQAMISW